MDRALIIGDPKHKYNMIIAQMVRKGEVSEGCVGFACFHDDDCAVWDAGAGICNCDVAVVPRLKLDD